MILFGHNESQYIGVKISVAGSPMRLDRSLSRAGPGTMMPAIYPVERR